MINIFPTLNARSQRMADSDRCTPQLASRPCAFTPFTRPVVLPSRDRARVVDGRIVRPLPLSVLAEMAVLTFKSRWAK